MFLRGASSALGAIQEKSMAMDDPSLLSCIDSDGRVDISKFLQRRRAEDESFDELLSLLDLEVSDSSPDDVEEDVGDDGTPVKKRRKKRHILARRTEDGELEAIPPTESTWYLQYIITPQVEDSAFLKKFPECLVLPVLATPPTSFTRCVLIASNATTRVARQNMQRVRTT